MDAEPQMRGGGLATSTSTGMAFVKGAAKEMVEVQRTQPVLMEIAPLSAETAACAPLVPLILPWMTEKGTPMMMMMNGTERLNSTPLNTKCRVQRGSDDCCRSTQVVSSQSPCTKERSAVTSIRRSRESGQWIAQPNTEYALNSSKYVNIGHSDDDQTRSKGEMYCKKHPLHAQAGKLDNWSKLLKPEVYVCNGEESWPPLLSSSKKEGNPKNITCLAQSIVDNSVSQASCIGTEDQFGQRRTLLDGNIEHFMLNQQCWPSLENLCKPSGSGGGHGIFIRKRALQPLAQKNATRASEQPATKALYKRPSVHFPPMLLMVNKDFIVTSPLKENLMLTLALMGRQSTANATENIHAHVIEVPETKKKVLVGQFRAFSSFLHFMLGHDATRVRTESNAGGTSTISECLSVEYFVRRFQAKDIVTEMEVEYCSFNWKKVDYICTLYGQRVGISVTRAMSFPDPKEFSAQMAYRLLHKKLFGLVVARHGVSKRHSFSQCILHVWCETRHTADLVRKEYDGVSQELDITDDVVMVLTVADGLHARPIFYESLLRNEQK